jgi:uncharacterized pyridoxal phosphate-containing UPF0001 family protein
VSDAVMVSGRSRPDAAGPVDRLRRPGAALGLDPVVFRRRLEVVRERIAAAGGDPAAVVIVGVTKTVSAAAATLALGAGVVDLGENYAQELVAKAAALEALGPPVPPRWHFLGRIQTNKIARLAPLVTLWQGVSAESEAVALARRVPGAHVLIEVDVVGGRQGCPPEATGNLVLAARDAGVVVEGLMTVAPAHDPEGARRAFVTVARLADRLELPVRSMGMSDDLEAAIGAGATMVRLGRALFGPRPRPGMREPAGTGEPAARPGGWTGAVSSVTADQLEDS